MEWTNIREVSDCPENIPGHQLLSQKSSDEHGTLHQASLLSVRAVMNLMRLNFTSVMKTTNTTYVIYKIIIIKTGEFKFGRVVKLLRGDTDSSKVE